MGYFILGVWLTLLIAAWINFIVVLEEEEEGTKILHVIFSIVIASTLFGIGYHLGELQ